MTNRERLERQADELLYMAVAQRVIRVIRNNVRVRGVSVRAAFKHEIERLGGVVFPEEARRIARAALFDGRKLERPEGTKHFARAPADGSRRRDAVKDRLKRERAAGVEIELMAYPEDRFRVRGLRGAGLRS